MYMVAGFCCGIRNQVRFLLAFYLSNSNFITLYGINFGLNLRNATSFNSDWTG